MSKIFDKTGLASTVVFGGLFWLKPFDIGNCRQSCGS